MEPALGPIRALLVDDHATFREGIARALSSEPGLKIEHCGSIREALEALGRKQFDLVLLDHDLGNERASHFLPAAREMGFGGRVLLVTAWVSEMEARRLLRQGVSGIFLKHAPLNTLVESIQGVAAGGTWIDPSFTEKPQPAENQPDSALFNDRQREVLRFVLDGLPNKDIAWRLRISESYVKAILQRLFEKTGVRTRGQLVRVTLEQYADQLGLPPARKP